MTTAPEKKKGTLPSSFGARSRLMGTRFQGVSERETRNRVSRGGASPTQAFPATKEEDDRIDRNELQQFLKSADFLSNYGMSTLISNMQAAASEVLMGKQLKDLFDSTVLQETIVKILDIFMSMGGPFQWVDYIMPEDARFYKFVAFSDSDGTNLSDVTKFDQLMVETRAVLSSVEFANIVDISLKTAVTALMEDIKAQLGEGNLLSGMPLAKILPRIAQITPLLFEEPINKRFIQIIQNIPEVEIFFTLLYANMPIS